MQFADDPWYIAMVVLLAITLLVIAYAFRNLIKPLLILAMALPPAIFKKVFGEPRH